MAKEPVEQPIVDAEFTVIHDPAWPVAAVKQKLPKPPMWREDLEFIGQMIGFLAFAPLLAWLFGRH